MWPSEMLTMGNALCVLSDNFCGEERTKEEEEKEVMKPSYVPWSL